MSSLCAELSATCDALGNYDKKIGKYLIDDYSLNTVKDLIRYLRRDGEEHEIRIYLGQTKILQTDLLPMMIDHWENTELFDITLRLIVNLTNPALLLYREEVPSERRARHNYLTILSHLQSYKEEAFSKVDTWNIFAKKLAKVLETDWSERDEDTGLIIERILILIRNVLHVPADLDHERKPDSDASVHDQVLWALNQSGICEIILYMSSENEKQYFMHILEIITHLLREQNPTSLANAALQRSVDEKLRDEQELLTLRTTEITQRNKKIRQYSSTRHSRFGSTYVVQNMKSISDNEIICFKPLNKMSNLDFGSGTTKEKFVKPKNRRPVESGTMERRSPFAVRLFLKEFCIDFLNSSYNTLMHHVKDILVRAKAQQNDESYYLWAVKFFLEFNRGHQFEVGLVSETISVPMFHYVQQQMEKYLDMIKVEKKKFTVWVRRLHLALRAYKELLNTLLHMDKSTDATVKESARVLKSNIFYVLEYREFILLTFITYDENKMPRSYVVDLVETVHLFLKMLQHFCTKTGLVVQKKMRKKKTKSQKSKPVKSGSQKPVAPEKPVWEEVRAQLAAVITGGVDEYPPPFDAASDIPIDEQKEHCMQNIQKFMRGLKFEDAVGILRAAREVWPDEGIFGESGISEDEELKMLESIYAADLGIETTEAINGINSEAEDYADSEDEEEEEERQVTAVVETDFDFEDFVQRFCLPKVVSACVFLLEGYEKNLPYTNHCIVKMLHRIAWDSKRPSMLFQATLLMIFQKVMNNPSPRFKELEKFGLFIIGKFREIASTNNKVFIELLFWKSAKETYEIEHGYETYNHSKVCKGAWTEEQEDELRKLYMENQENPATDKDVIDWMLENIIDQTRSRKGVIKKLKDLGLIFKAPTKKSHVRDKVSKEFGEDEDELLKEMWNLYSETSDPMKMIIAGMVRKRSKQSYINRLLELGIIDDKKQCWKKRSKSGDKGYDSEHKSDGDSSDPASNESDDSDDGRKKSPKAAKATKNVIPKRKQMKSSKSKGNTSVTLSASEVAKLLIEAVDNDLSEALKWVAENLEEIALDQEAEGYDAEGEGIPLVPITADSIDAMENETFQKVLKSIGISPPKDEQESYWRIQSSLHFSKIRNINAIISKAVEKTLIIEPESSKEDTPIPDNKHADSSDDDDLFDNLRRITESNDQSIEKSVTVSSRKRSRSNEYHKVVKKSKIQKIDEESNTDEERNTDEDSENILSFARKTLQQDTELPDTEDILSHMRQQTSDKSLSNSDKDEDSDEDVISSKRDHKKKRLVISDDESE